MPAYRKQVVTFLDIMGFREIVTTRRADEITEMLDLIERKAAVPAAVGTEPTSIISFSDSVIRGRPCAGDIIAALLHEIGVLAQAQWDLMDHRILVRGGVTIGDVLMQPGRAFGPAFVRAYELETSWAKSPRVVLDPESVRDIRVQAATGPFLSRRELIVSVRDCLRFDSDGLWFVDYIGAAFRRMPRDDHEAARARHRRIIIEAANDLKPGSTVLAKYLWLIRYFNSSATRLHRDKRALKIKRSDVPMADDLLIPINYKKGSL